MGTAVVPRDPRSLEVDPGDRTGIDVGDERLDLGDQSGVLRGDQAGVHRRGAMTQVRRDGALDLPRVRAREGATPTAVAVQVDESRKQHSSVHSTLRGAALAHLDDATVVDANPAIGPVAIRIDDALRSEHDRHAPTLGHGIHG